MFLKLYELNQINKFVTNKLHYLSNIRNTICTVRSQEVSVFKDIYIYIALLYSFQYNNGQCQYGIEITMYSITLKLYKAAIKNCCMQIS